MTLCCDGDTIGVSLAGGSVAIGGRSHKCSELTGSTVPYYPEADPTPFTDRIPPRLDSVTVRFIMPKGSGMDGAELSYNKFFNDSESIYITPRQHVPRRGYPARAVYEGADGATPRPPWPRVDVHTALPRAGRHRHGIHRPPARQILRNGQQRPPLQRAAVRARAGESLRVLRRKPAAHARGLYRQGREDALREPCPDRLHSPPAPPRSRQSGLPCNAQRHATPLPTD